MTVLRIFFDAPPAASRAFAWALFSAHGVCLREGHSTAEHWPRSAKREAVLAADLAPLLAFKLPPLSASRLESAVRLQLEDRLATPLSAQRIVIGSQQRDGWVRVVLTEQALLGALHKLGIDRAFSETELIDAAADTWHWCVSPEGRGFVRRDRNNGGSAFALDLPSAAANHKTPPAELTLALSAETAPPKMLCIHAALPAEILSSWQQASTFREALIYSASEMKREAHGAQQPRHIKTIGEVASTAQQSDSLAQPLNQRFPCRLAAEPPWHWTRAEPSLFAQATELLPQAESAASPSSRRSGAGWRIAAALVGIALALHIIATAAAWSSALWQHWQISRGWQALASEAGLPGKKSATAIPAQWSRAYAEARHRIGLAAPDDALPLLARAASPLRTLPPGTLRNAIYADRAWTFECAPLDAVTQKTLETNLRRTGLQLMSGNTAAGYRLRIQTQENAP